MLNDIIGNMFGAKGAAKPGLKPGAKLIRKALPGADAGATHNAAALQRSNDDAEARQLRRRALAKSASPTSQATRKYKEDGADPAEVADIVAPPAEAAAEAADVGEKKTESGRISYEGTLLTAAGGPLKIAPESRNLCALYDTGQWLVSKSYRTSPLVTSVKIQAERQGYEVGEAIFVTPDIIRNAYYHSDRALASVKLDDNAIRRKIVETLIKAREWGANDIHIESASSRTKVEFRLDSRLRLMETWTQKEGEQFLSAVFSHSSVQSGATANWQEPQAAMLERSAGADTIALPEGIISVRCQWMPLADGRYLNMRLSYDSLHIFGEGFVAADVDSLGFTPEQTETMRRIRSTPGRIRCICGPTNQGKTTTLRVLLNRRMAETNMELNCLLIEDPPEGGVIGARQIGVSATTNDDQREKTFMGVIRASLRLDPDILMLGEVRDQTTASFLFKLALAGRQVYTTVHVYSALAVPQRLRDIGMEPYLVYDHELLYGMTSQRLMRGLCKHCRFPVAEVAKHDPKVFQLMRRTRGALAYLEAEKKFAEAGGTVYDVVREPDMSGIFIENPAGCKHCDFKGRKGRTVAAEIVEADGKLMGLLAENHSAEAKKYWLAPGGLDGLSMPQHALLKVSRGEVSPTDAEFEMGILIRPRELDEVEKKIGTLRLS